MGLYDDGGVEFAKQTFEEARAYKEKVAKDENDFSKKVLGIDFLVSGANYLIDENAAKADRANLWQRGNYESLVSQSEKIRTQDSLNKQTGKSNIKYLEDNLYTQILGEATKDYAQADLDKLKPAFRKYANNLATDGLDEYEAMLNNAYNIPSFGKNGEEFEDWYKNNSNVPRNFVQWAGKKVKKIFKTNNKETLTHEVNKASEYNPNTGAFKPFGDLESSIKSYHAVTDKGFELAEIITKAKKDGLYLGKVVKINNPSSVDSYDYRKGIKITSISQSVLRENVNNVTDKNGKVPAYITDTYDIGTSTSQIKENMLTFTNIQDIKKLVKPGSLTAKNLDIILNNAPTFTEGTKAMELINSNTDDLAINWQDEKSFNEAFDTWYSASIQYAKHPTKDDKYLGKFDINLKKFVENPDYMEVIKKEGLDRETQRKIFKERGSSIGLEGTNNIEGEDTEQYTPLTSFYEKNPQVEEVLNTSLKAEGLGFSPNGFDLGRKIEQSISQGEQYVSLGIQDIGMVFQIPELEGTTINLYYDIEAQSYVQGK